MSIEFLAQVLLVWRIVDKGKYSLVSKHKKAYLVEGTENKYTEQHKDQIYWVLGSCKLSGQ